jgi:hypothetical protein
MLTKHPNIVYALPPKRSARRKKAAALHADTPRIVDATRKPPQYKAAQPAPVVTQRIVDNRKPGPLDDVDPVKAGEAADRLWQEIIQGPRTKAALDPGSRPIPRSVFRAPVSAKCARR